MSGLLGVLHLKMVGRVYLQPWPQSPTWKPLPIPIPSSRSNNQGQQHGLPNKKSQPGPWTGLRCVLVKNSRDQTIQNIVYMAAEGGVARESDQPILLTMQTPTPPGRNIAGGGSEWGLLKCRTKSRGLLAKVKVHSCMQKSEKVQIFRIMCRLH